MKNLLPISPEQIYAIILSVSGLLMRYVIYRRDCHRKSVAASSHLSNHYGNSHQLQLFQQAFKPFLKIFAWMLTLFGVLISGLEW
jgi:hypothetical protein